MKKVAGNFVKLGTIYTVAKQVTTLE